MKRLISIIILIQLTFLNADNYSLSFDGSDDYVNVADDNSLDFDGSTSFSVSAWVKTPDVPNSGMHAIVCKMPDGSGVSGWQFGFSAGGYTIFQHDGDGIDGPNVYGTTDVDDNAWHHISVTVDRSNQIIKVYFDGSLEGSDNMGNPSVDLSNTAPLFIGKDRGSTNFFNGKIDETAIWNDALTADEISALYNSGLGLDASFNNGDYTSSSNLQGYWKFDSGTGTTLTDQTSNDNDGTISGATWSSNVPPTSDGNNAVFGGSVAYDANPITDPSSSFTYSFWLKLDELPDQNERFFGGNNDAMDFSWQSDGSIHFMNFFSGYHNFDTEDANYFVPLNEWTHISFSRDVGGSRNIYINGELLMTAEDSGAEVSLPVPIFYCTANSVDDFRIWNYARSSSEISGDMNYVLQGNENGLVGYWNFNAGTGTTVTDQTSNGNNGTMSGSFWTGNGAPVTETITATNTHSLSFDGVDDYVEVPYSSGLNNFTDAISLMAWVKVTGNQGSQQTIIENGNVKGFVFAITNDLKIYPHLKTTDGWFNSPLGSSMEMDTWHHVTFTYNGSALIGFLNGQEIGSLSVSGTIENNDGNLNFGFDSNWQNYFNGNIDDVSIWNTALNQSEIQNNMSTELNGNETGLVGYWNFNEGSGTTLTDQTSNGNNGTINGATWSTDVPFAGTTTTSALTWSVQAQASLGSYNDNDNYLGVASDATNTFDASYDVLEPPASPGSSVSLYFPHEEWDYLLGDNFSTDARPEVTLTDTMQVWDFEVSSTDGGEATLTFVFSDVPEVPVILENTATGARQTLSNNATYTFTAVADSAHPFRVSIGDTTSPSLTLGSSCSGPAILISDSTHSLDWTSTDGFEVDSVLVSFSSDSGTTYTLQAALGTVSGYDWTVPDAVVMTGGKFKVKSQDYAGNSVEKVSDYVFAIAGDSLSSAVTAGWTLWGAPINPANDTMSANLSDDFSDYWDTFDYVDNGYTYDGILLEGEGYWLGAAQSATIDVQGTPIASDFTMSLSQGWELISNPLVLDISIDSLTFTKDDETKTHAEAVTAGWVNSMYGYDGSGYVAATTLEPWSGYWLGVLETDIEMTFPIHRHDGSDNSRSRDEDWMIAFDAEVEGANDEMMRIGYAETATDGFDTEHDAVNPPNPPGPVYISLFTNHPEWEYILGDKFTKDIRAEVPENGYQEWILSMESSESEAQISWTFENVPDEYDIGYSINDGVYFEDMRSVSTTTLSVSTEIIVRVGTQILGIGDEPIPEVFALHQNYPNPFNPTTQIRYDLPEDALVSITIYDIMGRSIKSLVNSNQTAGYRSIRWDGKNNLGEGVSAGMYIYMIQAGKFSQTKKMVLLK